MKILRTIDETRRAVAGARLAGKTIALVPTMGFLHEGHLSLIREARTAGADFVVFSIFVNPKQFGPGEDFDRYPRDEKRDTALLKGEKVDALFAPPPEVMYPEGSTTSIDVGPVAAPLEGKRRPGHFAGVATIVSKLFNIVQPDLAVFGQKDAQQCAVISRMVKDLDIPVNLIMAETVREQDGLAMSSRNSYLSKRERELAPHLLAGLRAGEAALRSSGDISAAEKAMERSLSAVDEVRVDYLRLVDPATFRRPEGNPDRILLVGAVRIGHTRLIDNIIIERVSPARTDKRRRSRQPGSSK